MRRASEIESLKVQSLEGEVLRASAKRGLVDEDARQVGRMAAVKAVHLHDPKRGALSHVAWMWISQALDKEVRRRRRRAQQDRATAPTLTADVVLDEVAVAVRMAIELLPLRLQEIVYARMAGFTLEEVGAEMGIGRERVRQLEFRAHLLLREQLS